MEAYAHLKSGDELKAEGNAEFRAGRHAAAVAKYKAALKKKTLEASLRSSLLCNVAVCQVKLEQWEEAITAASECLRGDGAEAKTRAKALLFRSRAYRRSPHRCGGDGRGAAIAGLEDLTRGMAEQPAA